MYTTPIISAICSLAILKLAPYFLHGSRPNWFGFFCCIVCFLYTVAIPAVYWLVQQHQSAAADPSTAQEEVEEHHVLRVANDDVMMEAMPDRTNTPRPSAPFATPPAMTTPHSTPTNNTPALRRSPRPSYPPTRFIDEYLEKYSPKWWRDLYARGIPSQIDARYRTWFGSPYPKKKSSKSAARRESFDITPSPAPSSRYELRLHRITPAPSSSSPYSYDLRPRY